MAIRRCRVASVGAYGDIRGQEVTAEILDAHVDRVTASRHALLRSRALAHPEGLPPHKFTAGLPKSAALMFWTDAREIGLIRVGVTPRGARLFALQSYAVVS